MENETKVAQDFPAYCKANGLDLSKLVTDAKAFKEARDKWQASLPKKSTPGTTPGASHLVLYVSGVHTAELQLKRGRSVERDTLMAQYRMAVDSGLTACLIRYSDDGFGIELSQPPVSIDALGAFLCGESKTVQPGVKRGKK